MLQLNFPSYDVKLRQNNSQQEIFDPVRRKFVVLTPEEWVRQHLIAYLFHHKSVPLKMIGVEKQLFIHRQLKRFDLVVFSRQAVPLLLAECKSPQVEITEKVFDQAARYNLHLKAHYFLITNGLDHYSCRLDYVSQKYSFTVEIPDYQNL